MTPLHQWRPALRMARRDLRRHKVRALLTCVLVALPVVVATGAALGSYNSRWDREQEAQASLGPADAEVLVSRFAAVRPRPALSLSVRPAEFTSGAGDRKPVLRDRASVDLESLLPAGSALTPKPRPRAVALTSGGNAWVHFADFESSLSEYLVRITAGRAPSAADEVAVPEVAADELGLLRGGAPSDGATLSLSDGTVLRVVGVAEFGPFAEGIGLPMAAPVDSVLRGEQPHVNYLVDLPGQTRPELKSIIAELNAAGVAVRPRDAILHPGAWFGRADVATEFDVEPLVTGAFVILVGMLEVVLLVGAAFAVAARRQVRDLGLLAANGGAAGDVRRVLLAQGVVLGVGSSLVGVLVGVVAFRNSTSLWEQVFGTEMWRQEIDWLALALIMVLGSLTSVVAALLPGWNVSRLTPVAALSGRFPVRSGESRAHRGAFVLAGLGMAVLLVGGWLTARTFGPRGREITLAPFIAGLGLLLLVAGAIWATPYLVRRVALLGRRLPLSGRYAFRDAARHRFRSAAATMALMITVTGAVLAAFAFSSAAQAAHGTDDLPAHTMELYVDGSVDRDRLDALRSTLEGVVGPVDLAASSGLALAARPNSYVTVGRHGSELRVVDEPTLRLLAGGDDEETVEAFRDGALVTIGRRRDDGGTGTANVVARRGHGQSPTVWTVPQLTRERGSDIGDGGMGLGSAFVAQATADRLGLETRWMGLRVLAERPFSQDALDRLAVHGLDGWSSDPDRLTAARMQFAGVGGAAVLSALVVGVAVALAAAESREEVATLAAVGAGPWRRRSMGAMHGLFLAVVGCLLGLVIGVPAGLALTQVDGLRGVDVPWLATLGTFGVVSVAATVAGWVVTPSRLRLTRRTA